MATLVGRYQIISSLCTGKVGTVFKAWDPQLNRRVALKLVRPQYIRRPAAQRRLLKEIRALAKVSHPNVLPLYDGGLLENQFYAVMELVEGRSLREWLGEAPRTPLEIVETYAAAGRALAAAHRAGLIHRHFQANDVLMAHDGRILVVDFGLTADTLEFTAKDARADQYDFCASLRDALRGASPGAWSQRTSLKVWRAINRGLSPRPEDRFASMEQLLTDLLLAFPGRRSQVRRRVTHQQSAAPTTSGPLPNARQSLFVGREQELSTFSKILRSKAPGTQVLFIYGPGGTGKTTLLYQFHRACEQAGVPAVRLDMRDVPASPPELTEALAQSMGLQHSALAKGWPTDRRVVFLDTFEAAAGLEGWLRDVLLPQLPPETVFALAGRSEPSVAWTTDPGWRGLFYKLRVDDLSPAESQEYLRRRNVLPEQQRDILAFAHGHPLALSLVADVIERRPGQTFKVDEARGVVQTLVERLVQNVPSESHRAALEACAIVRTTTESWLKAALEMEDVHPLYFWLRDLSFMQLGKAGIYPHDVAREALVIDLRLRDPARYQLLQAKAFELCNQRVNQALTFNEQNQAALDHLFLFRADPVGVRYTNTGAREVQELTIELATSKDWDEILAMVRHHEGPTSAAIAAHWLRRQPNSAQVVRRPNSGRAVVGFTMYVDLERTTASERGKDPAVEAAWAHLVRIGIPLRGRTMTFKRFWMDRDCYQDLSPVQAICNVASLRYFLSHPDIVYSLVAYGNPEPYVALCASRRYTRLTELDFQVDGKTYAVFGRDWRGEPPIVWRWKDMPELTQGTPALG